MFPFYSFMGEMTMECKIYMRRKARLWMNYLGLPTQPIHKYHTHTHTIAISVYVSIFPPCYTNCHMYSDDEKTFLMMLSPSNISLSTYWFKLRLSWIMTKDWESKADYWSHVHRKLNCFFRIVMNTIWDGSFLMLITVAE
jgi:hypothetical protein